MHQTSTNPFNRSHWVICTENTQSVFRRACLALSFHKAINIFIVTDSSFCMWKHARLTNYLLVTLILVNNVAGIDWHHQAIAGTNLKSRLLPSIPLQFRRNVKDTTAMIIVSNYIYKDIFKICKISTKRLFLCSICNVNVQMTITELYWEKQG